MGCGQSVDVDILNSSSLHPLSIRAATTPDLTAIKTLLERGGLPKQDCHQHLANFIILESDNNIIGIGGLEFYSEFALLRSVAIEKKYRGHSFGNIIFTALKETALSCGVRQMYLLTETATDYFSNLGFTPINRINAPDAIKKTAQFSSLCSHSATLMTLSIS